jgi:hypothetical protein
MNVFEINKISGEGEKVVCKSRETEFSSERERKEVVCKSREAEFSACETIQRT